MSPYDFQDLAAALLEAMGYRVLWVAPPGPDRGVGFTKGTRDEARNHETRRLTLFDLEQLLDLWISHYDRIAEDMKFMLPLRPVYYLAPS